MLAFAAGAANNREMVKLLLEHGADANSHTMYHDRGVVVGGEGRFDIKFLSVHNGRLTIYPALAVAMGYGCNIGHWYYNYDPDPEIVKLLLEHGADPDAAERSFDKNEDGEYEKGDGRPGLTMLCCAVETMKKEIVELLLKYGADASAGKGLCNPLCYALGDRWSMGVRCSGRYPNEEAYLAEQRDIFDILLKHGADPLKMDDDCFKYMVKNGWWSNPNE